MTTPSAEHLFEQAERLASPIAAGSVRQVDLRRAISAAYYGIFHFCLTTVADEFVGVGQRTTSRYALVYRSIDHRTLKDLCVETKKVAPAARYQPWFPPGGFDAYLRAFATTVLELQGDRHLADYHPQEQFSVRDAKLAVSDTRAAVSRFRAADEDQRQLFLTLLAFPPR